MNIEKLMKTLGIREADRDLFEALVEAPPGKARTDALNAFQKAYGRKLTPAQLNRIFGI